MSNSLRSFLILTAKQKGSQQNRNRDWLGHEISDAHCTAMDFRSKKKGKLGTMTFADRKILLLLGKPWVRNIQIAVSIKCPASACCPALLLRQQH